MEKKTDMAIRLFTTGNIKEALKIAKTFRIGLTADDRDKIIRAYECIVHADFYKMLGKNPEEEIEKGVMVFKDKIAGEKIA